MIPMRWVLLGTLLAKRLLKRVACAVYRQVRSMFLNSLSIHPMVEKATVFNENIHSDNIAPPCNQSSINPPWRSLSVSLLLARDNTVRRSRSSTALAPSAFRPSISSLPRLPLRMAFLYKYRLGLFLTRPSSSYPTHSSRTSSFILAFYFQARLNSYHLFARFRLPVVQY